MAWIRTHARNNQNTAYSTYLFYYQYFPLRGIILTAVAFIYIQKMYVIFQSNYDFEANTWKASARSIGQEIAVRFSIGSQASSPISEAIIVPNMNFQFEIRNNIWGCFNLLFLISYFSE